ncbi:MAG: hypothetical protein CMF20_08430 [Idiomarinaceae bacterium]|nr:hypothetical protein [Idiomarinaceae bacterium]
MVLGFAIGCIVFIKFRKLLSDWDPKKKEREHQKFRIEALGTLSGISPHKASELIIYDSDTALVRSLKEKVWEAYGVKYVFVEELGLDAVAQLRFPLSTVEAYVNGRRALEPCSSNLYDAWCIKKSSKFNQKSSGLFLLIAVICITFSLSGLAGSWIKDVFESDSNHSLDELIQPLFVLGIVMAVPGYALFDNVKEVMSAYQFKQLWKQKLSHAKGVHNNSEEKEADNVSSG